jgi:hypothetical protein
VAAGAAVLLLGSVAAGAQETVVAKVNGKTITEADMRLAEAEIGSDLGSLPDITKRRVLVEFLIENQLFADAAEGQKLAAGADYNERMQYWRRRSLRDLYFDKTVKDTVSDAEAKKFYDSQISAAKPEEEVRARIPGRGKKRLASCSRRSPTAPTSPSLPSSFRRTLAARTRVATSATSRRARWCRNSRRTPSSCRRAR